MERVAEHENRDAAFVREQVAADEAVIPANRAHESLDPVIIGREFATKVNANIGNSETTSDRTEKQPERARERDARDGAVERDGRLGDEAHVSAFFRRGINVRRPVTRPVVARSSPCRRSSPVATVLIT